MGVVLITGHQEKPDLSSMGGNYRCYAVTGTYDGTPFTFLAEDGQIDYESEPPCLTNEDWENDIVHIAWGEYAEKHQIDLGVVHR